MISFYPEQFLSHIIYKLQYNYLIFGNNTFLIQEIIDHICKIAKQQNFNKRYYFILESKTNWENIYEIIQSPNLFTKKQILILTLSENSYTKFIANNLFKITKFLHQDLLFIINGTKLTAIQKNSLWYKQIEKNTIFINCTTPTQTRLSNWIIQKSKSMSLTLDLNSIEFICKYYEGNLQKINQILNILSLLTSNSTIVLSDIKNIINNNFDVNYTPSQWINTIFEGNTYKSLNILQNFKLNNFNINILLRTIQPEIILLLFLKVNNLNIEKIFNKYQIWLSRRPLIINTLNRLTICKIQLTIKLLMQAELILKKNDNDYIIWQKLEIISILLTE